LKRKVFLKNQKHQPNIVEITHLCIMHRVHTSLAKFSTSKKKRERKKKRKKKKDTATKEWLGEGRN